MKSWKSTVGVGVIAPVVGVPSFIKEGSSGRFRRFVLFACVVLGAFITLSAHSQESGYVKDLTVEVDTNGSVVVRLDDIQSSLPRAGDRIMQRSFDLVTWEELGSFPADYQEKEFEDSSSTNPVVAKAFYRIVVEPENQTEGGVSFQLTPVSSLDELDELLSEAGIVAPLDRVQTLQMINVGETPILSYWTTNNVSQATDLLNSSSAIMEAVPEISGVSSGDSLIWEDLNSWGLGDGFGIYATEVWNQGYVGSRDVVVAVIDSGLDILHPAFQGNIWVNTNEVAGNGLDDDGNGFVDDIHGWDFVEDMPLSYDPAGHGTQVAGVIGASGLESSQIGINQHIQILPLRWQNENGKGKTPDAVAAIDYVTALKQAGVNVVAINLSWTEKEYSSFLHRAVTHAADAGILSVCAAGNNNLLDNDLYPQYPSSLNTADPSQATYWLDSTPYDSIVSVAAITQFGELTPSSHYGAESVDLAAPGDDIISTLPGNGYGRGKGTSLAAPHVTGALALYASAHDTDALGLKEALLSSTVSTTTLEGKTSSGGRLHLPSLMDFPHYDNRNPVAVDDYVTFSGTNVVEIYVLENDSDVDADSIMLRAYTPSFKQGKVELGTNGVLRYTAYDKKVKSDFFSYTIEDSEGATATAVVRLTNSDRKNVAPRAKIDKFTFYSEWESLDLSLLLNNDSDGNGDELSLFCVGDVVGFNGTNASHGRIECVNGLPHYVPDIGYEAADQFTYVVTDGNLFSVGEVNLKIKLKSISENKPVLVAPLNMETNVFTTPLFKWKRVKGAPLYDLEICKKRMGRKPVEFSGIPGTTFRLPEESALNPGVKYFWRVRASVEDETETDAGTWSRYEAFYCSENGRVDVAPELILPAHGAMSGDTRPVFEWEPVDNAQQYIIQISKGIATHMALETSETLSASTLSYTLPVEVELDPDQVYFWRVMANNGEGLGSWSCWSGFKVLDYGLVSPADGETGVELNPEFQWTGAGGEHEYTLRVYHNSGAVVEGFDVGGQSLFKLPPSYSLEHGTQYTWEVETYLGGEVIFSSDLFSFTTVQPLPDAPYLIRPLDDAGTRIEGAGIVFEWEPVEHAESYDLVVYRLNRNGNYKQYKSFPVTTPEMVFSTDLSPGKDWCWKVCAKNIDGQKGEWSELSYFATSYQSPAPPVVTVILPKGNVKFLEQSIVDFKAKVVPSTNVQKVEFSCPRLMQGYPFTTIHGIHSRYTTHWGDALYPQGIIGVEPFEVEVKAAYDASSDPSIISIAEVASTCNFEICKANALHDVITPGIPYGPLYAINVETNKRFGFRFDLDTNRRWNLKIQTYGGAQAKGLLKLHAERGEDISSAQQVEFYDGSGEGVDWGIHRPEAIGGRWNVALEFDSTKDTGTYKDVYLLVTALPLPAKPSLQSPQDGARLVGKRPTFAWTGDSETLSYELELYRDGTDSSKLARSFPSADVPVLTGASLSIPESSNRLYANRTYFWRVRGINGNGNGIWSDFSEFKTRLKEPTLLGPGNLSIARLSRPSFSWESVEDAASYILEIYSKETGVLQRSYPDLSSTTFKIPEGDELGSHKSYLWKVRAVNAAGENGLWADFFEFETRLEKVDLLSPVDDAKLVRQRPTFDWTGDSEAQSYVLEIYRNDTEGDPIRTYPNSSVPSLTSSFLTIPDSQSGLNYDTVYYWRVKGIASNGESEWSDFFKFKTRLSSPSLSSPNGTMTALKRPTYSWSGVPGASSYKLEVYRNGTSILEKSYTDIGGISFEPSEGDDLSHYTTYYWRARAVGVDGNGAWSDFFWFKTRMEEITLVSPSNGAVDRNYRPLFEWEANPHAATYELRIYRKDSGTLKREYTGLTGTAFRIPDIETQKLGGGNEFTWTMRGVDSGGNFGSWSDEYSFRTRE